MLDKINKKAVIQSFFLGVAIGVSAHLMVIGVDSPAQMALSVVISGLIGLFIGLVTEAFTAILPISLAKPRWYYAINNLIAITLALMIFVIGRPFFSGDLTSREFSSLVAFILVIIAVANLFEYLNYRRINKRLSEYQKSRKE